MESLLNSKSSRLNVNQLYFHENIKYSGPSSSVLQNPEIKSAGSQGPNNDKIYT